MKYQNNVTGLIYNFNCEIKGEHWVKLDAPSEIAEEKKEEPKKTKRVKK